ncbi:hypothetical protein K1719_001405 [Acacia pycnantha]|nr:hypothetical protein K1719_001405 [Acacia pycnantha]
MRRKKINELLSRCSKPNLQSRIAGDYQTLLQRQTPSPKGSTDRQFPKYGDPVRQFPKYRIRALALSLIASSSRAINKQEYDLANAKFALELAQKRPPQVPTPLLVTPANNPLDTPYIAKLAQVQHVLQLEPEFFFGTPNEVALKVFPSGFHFIPTNSQKTREYYELILVHSQSIELTRYISKEDETLITHSTLQIVKVLTPS